MYPILKTIAALAPRAALLAALALLAPLSACQLMPNEQEEGAPKARLRVAHADPRLGPVEVLLDEQVVLTVEPGAVSEEATINAGEWALSFRSAGAMQAVVTTEVLAFGEHLSVVALTEGDGDERLLLATEPPPAAEEGAHQLRVLDLTGRAEPTRVFHGLTRVLDLPVAGRLSPFLSVEPSPASGAFTLADATSGAPLPSESPRVALEAGGATFVVARRGGGEAGEGAEAAPDGFAFEAFDIR